MEINNAELYNAILFLHIDGKIMKDNGQNLSIILYQGIT
jgi:hypothetical protein